jgi:hypothetical protein
MNTNRALCAKRRGLSALAMRKWTSEPSGKIIAALSAARIAALETELGVPHKLPTLNVNRAQARLAELEAQRAGKVIAANPPISYDRISQQFSPSLALSFAESLSKATSDDEAIGATMRNPEGLAAFLVAAHFAYPYLPVSRGSSRARNQESFPRYVALASAVGNFLRLLSPQSHETDRQET